MNNTNDVIDIRIPYEERSSWMQEKHRQYGKQCFLRDIDNLDNMWIEETTGDLAALVEFKQDKEEIIAWKYKAMKKLADNSKIPFYICVGYRNTGIAYYIIPMNDYAKAFKNLDKPRFMTEATYINFLHHIRGIKADPKVFEGKNKTLPEGLVPPFITW